MNKHIPAKLNKKAFTCPHCEVNAQQYWHFSLYGEISPSIGIIDSPSISGDYTLDQHKGHYRIAECTHCKNFSFWDSKGKMLIPKEITAPPPNEDMPNEVKEIYQEARAVQSISPRAAAALLRVALEKLCEELGEKKGNLNKRISNLEKKGLPEKVIKDLNIVRIYGNEGGSHAGQIDLTGKDNEEIVKGLFNLVNFIVKETITDPKVTESLFNNLPKNKK